MTCHSKMLSRKGGEKGSRWKRFYSGIEGNEEKIRICGTAK